MFIFQKKFKKMLFRTLILMGIVFLQSIFFSFANAKDDPSEIDVDYKGEIIIDSDLDGLTDEGERRIFKTDPLLPDTDGDGFFDGAEVLNGTDSLDKTDPLEKEIANLTEGYSDKKTPWMWYFSRASGFLSYIFLWFSILLGLAIRNTLLQKIIKPIYSLDLHCFTSVSAIFWALFHGASFLFHEGTFRMSFKDAFIPLYSKSNLVNGEYLAFGIIAFYILVVLAVTSFAKRWISHRSWRMAHYLNWLLLPLLGVHTLLLGTDMQNQVVKVTFLSSIFLLIPLYFANLFSVIKNKLTPKVKGK